MNRDVGLDRVRAGERFDVLIIGGGASGLGAAADAASRGHRVCLIEQADFANGTSSRSTKLIHGGVRYLRQGAISMVLGALRERERLRKNAPHLVSSVPFAIPAYRWWQRLYYGVGLKLYEEMGGEDGFASSQILSRDELLEHLPTIETEGLRGGVLYYDGQFDDARLAINLAQTAFDHGAVVLNRVRCVGFRREGDRLAGVLAQDSETGAELEIAAAVVINATGPFSDSVRRQDDPQVPKRLRPSQGVHVVLPRSFLSGRTAMLIPSTDDGRVIFAVPWHDRVVAGTTDTAVGDEIVLEPRAIQSEFDFLLSHLARYLSCDPTPDDVLSVFAGLRPLVSKSGAANTAALSRDHVIEVSDSGLVSIMGGKWTTYRKMAEEVVDRAEAVGGLTARDCVTATLMLHGAEPGACAISSEVTNYGSDAKEIAHLIADAPGSSERVHPRLTLRRAEVLWHVRGEMARTVDDVLARRSRSLLLDAAAALEAAPEVARILAAELAWDADREAQELESFRSIASGYLAANYC